MKGSETCRKIQKDRERDKSGRETQNSEENWTHCDNPHEKKRKGGEKVRE